ncbi:phage head spike fiber domain-containing protein [Reyranella sp.]|uniref:phage head spike fiber domain-containing protein n=1 Tax=Reyranella sp. TaxID=1929291 RepID=UPI003BAA2426
MITIDFVYDPRYADRFEPFFRIKDQLADLSVRLLDNAPGASSDVAIVQSHLVGELRGKKDTRVLRPMIVNERADQETIAFPNRGLLKEPNTLAWLKECTIRDPSLHNAPHVGGYYHYNVIAHDPSKYPEQVPDVKVDASDIAKIRLPFSVASYSRFARLRARPSVEARLRNVDAFMWGTVKSAHPLYQEHRASGCRALANVAASNPHYNVLLGVGRGLGDSEVHDILFRSKIVVSQFGHSMSSYKDWEALYAGCVLIRPDASLQQNYLPDVFKDNEWYVPCAPDFSDLEQKMAMVLEDYPRYFERAQIARSALMESTNADRLASDFYHMICDVLNEAPSASVRRFAPIEPASYREAVPDNLKGAGQPSVAREYFSNTGHNAMSNDDAGATPLRGENLFGATADLGSGAWAIVRSQLDPAPIGGPGGVVGRRLVEDTSASTHDFRRILPKESVQEDYVLSFMAKPKERSLVQVWLGSSTQAERAQISFDLLRGRTLNARTQGKGWANLGAGMSCLDDGWWWCWTAVRTDDTSHLATLVALEAPDGNIGFGGDGSSGMWFGNLRLEKGRVPTFVLPTASNPVPVSGKDTGATKDAVKVSVEMGEYYDRYFSTTRSREIAGFHGDYFLMRYMFNLLEQADTFVETGSLSGDTVGTVARNFPDVDCHTCELDERNFSITRRRTEQYANVTASNEPSPDFLYSLYDRQPELKTRRVVFWLDAHARGALPLPQEVEKITASGTEFCVAIDDFQVPGRPYFQFDSYPPLQLNWDLIQPYLKAGRKYKIVYPKYETHTSLHAPRVGWIVVVAGDWKLAPDGLKDLYDVFDYESPPEMLSA